MISNTRHRPVATMARLHPAGAYGQVKAEKIPE
jgi:hypothetical protein